ncbi:hypothetical protein IWZ03DRAFT_123652 [Phyllosticta citriasiana]|uniref:Uncharacterized protein n=1 Tax=Phyllosticta citriasiana TaxID=595635 RepID=A0ABR1K787_9PEZI
MLHCTASRIAGGPKTLLSRPGCDDFARAAPEEDEGARRWPAKILRCSFSRKRDGEAVMQNQKFGIALRLGWMGVMSLATAGDASPGASAPRRHNTTCLHIFPTCILPSIRSALLSPWPRERRLFRLSPLTSVFPGPRQPRRRPGRQQPLTSTSTFQRRRKHLRPPVIRTNALSLPPFSDAPQAPPPADLGLVCSFGLSSPSTEEEEEV